MIDLIDRKKLLDELRLCSTDMSNNDCDFIERLINSQRTINPIQHAHWIYNKELSEGHIEKIYNCSACQHEAWGESEKTNFCPFCGYEMVDKEENNYV